MREPHSSIPRERDDAIVLSEIDLRGTEIGIPPSDEPPLIIVGDPGARAMLGEFLNQCSPFACTIEDDLLVEMALAAQDSAVRLARQGHAVSYWYAGLARSYRGMQSNRLAGSGKARWACTVDAERLSVGLLGRLFPDAHVVNVLPVNRRQRRAQRGLRLAAGAFPAGCYHEVEEAELITRTEECLLRLLVAVGALEWDSDPA